MHGPNPFLICLYVALRTSALVLFVRFEAAVDEAAVTDSFDDASELAIAACSMGDADSNWITNGRVHFGQAIVFPMKDLYFSETRNLF